MPSAASSRRSIDANSRSTPIIVQFCFIEPDNSDTFISSPHTDLPHKFIFFIAKEFVCHSGQERHFGRGRFPLAMLRRSTPPTRCSGQKTVCAIGYYCWVAPGSVQIRAGSVLWNFTYLCANLTISDRDIVRGVLHWWANRSRRSRQHGPGHRPPHVPDHRI